MEVSIRRAKNTESGILSDISFSSKRHWKYPEEYFETWKNELTITPSYIDNNMVYVAESSEKVLGYFSIVEVKEDLWAGEVFVRKGFWLEHIFILPKYIYRGIGMSLIEYAKEICRQSGIEKLLIFSDPNSKGFYDKIGANYIIESPSSIKGRTVSLYELEITGRG